MLISFHVTHTTFGATGVADVIPVLKANVEGYLNSLKCLNGYVVLDTCNRFEIYADTTDDSCTEIDFASFGMRFVLNENGWYVLKGIKTVKQLFRVTSGLDSVVIGEDQIQGQVRNAYQKSIDSGKANDILIELFERALHTGKRVRTETNLNTGILSVGSAAIDYAEQELGSLSDKTVAIVGAGEMGALIAKHLNERETKAIIISNRTFGNAQTLANEIGGEAVRMDDLIETVKRSDVVFLATNAPHPIIRKKDIESALEDRESVVLVDISVPRNVSDDINGMDNVKLYTMDDISTLTAQTLIKRRQEISEAEKIVFAEIQRLENETKESEADMVIGSLARKIAEIRERELAFALSRLENGGDSFTVMEEMSKAIVKKIMADPYENLRCASRNGKSDLCRAAIDIFGVDNDVPKH